MKSFSFGGFFLLCFFFWNTDKFLIYLSFIYLISLRSKDFHFIVHQLLHFLTTFVQIFCMNSLNPADSLAASLLSVFPHVGKNICSTCEHLRCSTGASLTAST